jgi:hypothetical protein
VFSLSSLVVSLIFITHLPWLIAQQPRRKRRGRNLKLAMVASSPHQGRAVEAEPDFAPAEEITGSINTTNPGHGQLINGREFEPIDPRAGPKHGVDSNLGTVYSGDAEDSHLLKQPSILKNFSDAMDLNKGFAYGPPIPINPGQFTQGPKRSIAPVNPTLSLAQPHGSKYLAQPPVEPFRSTTSWAGGKHSQGSISASSTGSTG